MRHKKVQQNISRLMALLLCVTFLFAGATVVWADGESGSCGDKLEWSLSGGTLTITGSGAMTDFPESTMAPWYHLRKEIYRLELPEELTSIGSLAFYECEKLTVVSIPDGVKKIGSYAFAGCTDMKMLTLGKGVKSIGEAAFSDCYELADLRLPDGLQSIGMKAFYRCESITTLTVPASVTDIGIEAFGYCKSLVSADIQAKISQIPDLLFYGCKKLVSVTLPDSADQISEFVFRGCDNLSTVYYDGSNKTPNEIQQIIDKGLPGFGSTGFVSNGTPTNTDISGTATENPDGTITQENTTVNRGENSTVSTTVTNTHPEDSLSGSITTDITITVEGEEGWKEAQDALEDALKEVNTTVTLTGSTGGQTNVTVYVKDTNTIDQSFIDSLAGKNVTVTVITQDGSTWQIKGSDLLQTEEPPESYDLRYEVTAGSAELCAELGVSRCYVLRFLAPAQINAEVMIRLSTDLHLQNATLLQQDKKERKQIQTTVVDSEGYAHFYLASVTEETEYYIAINLPQPEQEVIVPEAVQEAYGSPEQIQPIRYEVTGRTSSWGMNLGQVMGILAAVMVTVIVVVGAVMFIWNKRRLKNGYVPDFDDEDE